MTRETVVNAATGAFLGFLARYRDYAAAVARYVSPNAEDDEYVKFAIAGFASVAAVDRWGLEHFTGIQELRSGELSNRALAWHGRYAEQYARFACLCYGALFGLQEIGALEDDDDFEIAESSMPGFMMTHLEEIYALAEVPRDA